MSDNWQTKCRIRRVNQPILPEEGCRYCMLGKRFIRICKQKIHGKKINGSLGGKFFIFFSDGIHSQRFSSQITVPVQVIIQCRRTQLVPCRPHPVTAAALEFPARKLREVILYFRVLYILLVPFGMTCLVDKDTGKPEGIRIPERLVDKYGRWLLLRSDTNGIERLFAGFELCDVAHVPS